MPAKKLNWKRLIPGLLISLVCLIIVLVIADPRQLLTQIQLADYRLFVLGMLVVVVWLMARSMYWRTLLQRKATFSQTFFTVSEGYLLNNLLPFRLGEVARAYLLGWKTNLGFWFVFSTILIERLMDVAMALGLLLATLPFVLGADWAVQAAIVAGTLVIAGLGTLLWMAHHRDWLVAQFSRLSQRWKILQRFGHARVDAFISGLAVLTDTKLFFQALFWLVLNWLLGILQYYLMMKAFIPEAQPLWAAFTLAFMAIGVAAPSSPGAMGVFELSVVAALSFFGVDPAVSGAYALTMHAAHYLTTGILGTIGLIKDGLSLSGIYQKAQSVPLELSES